MLFNSQTHIKDTFSFWKYRSLSPCSTFEFQLGSSNEGSAHESRSGRVPVMREASILRALFIRERRNTACRAICLLDMSRAASTRACWDVVIWTDKGSNLETRLQPSLHWDVALKSLKVIDQNEQFLHKHITSVSKSRTRTGNLVSNQAHGFLDCGRS